MHALVTGGTGLIGVHTIAALLSAGHSVKALVRNTDKLTKALEPLGYSLADLEVATGDITDKTSVANAVKGCNALIHSAGVFSNKLEDADWLYKSISIKRHHIATLDEFSERVRDESGLIADRSKLFQLFAEIIDLYGPTIKLEEVTNVTDLRDAIIRALQEKGVKNRRE